MNLGTHEERERERRLDEAYGATIEGGCWFRHTGLIDEMEKDYGKRGRERDTPETEQSLPEPQ